MILCSRTLSDGLYPVTQEPSLWGSVEVEEDGNHLDAINLYPFLQMKASTPELGHIRASNSGDLIFRVGENLVDTTSGVSSACHVVSN